MERVAKLGYEVIHGSRALFGCSLIWGTKGRRRNISGAIFRRVASPAGHGVRG